MGVAKSHFSQHAFEACRRQILGREPKDEELQRVPSFFQDFFQGGACLPKASGGGSLGMQACSRSSHSHITLPNLNPRHLPNQKPITINQQHHAKNIISHPLRSTHPPNLLTLVAHKPPPNPQPSSYFPGHALSVIQFQAIMLETRFTTTSQCPILIPSTSQPTNQKPKTNNPKQTPHLDIRNTDKSAA